MKTKVHVKEDNKNISVNILTYMYKELSKNVLSNWQSMINYMTEQIGCSVGVINVITESHIKEFVKSNSVIYPYRTYQSNKLLEGLFCETVLAKDKTVYVPNVNEDNIWGKSDVLFKAISYYGIPIKYSSGEYFGTLAIFNNKEMDLNSLDKDLITMVRDSIEKDLHILLMKKEVSKLSTLDPVTGLYNKHKIDDIIYDYQQELNRDIIILSIAKISISNFKDIQLNKGDQAAEEMLILLARIMKNRARYVDRIGRLDVSEFIIISKGSTAEGQEVLLRDLKRFSQVHLQLEEYNIQFDYSIKEVGYGEEITEKIEIATT